MKALTIVGARPQFIKQAPLSEVLRKNCDEVIVHTGQHYDFELSKVFFDELDIPEPDYNLEVGSGSHGEQTGKMLIRIEKVLQKEQPDVVILYGDTNSTVAGALAASKLHIKIAHVEAGLRNFDRKKPEEINRIVTDHISDIMLVPTENAARNLKNEGIDKNVFNTGDIMYDVFKKYKDVIEKESRVLSDLGLNKKDYLLLTIHKQKNTDNRERLTEIIRALTSLDRRFIFPIHPRTRKFLKRYGLWDGLSNSNIRIIKPLGYIDFMKLMKNAEKVVTDSGGMQKEAYMWGVPCITMRETEWVETVENGWNVLVDSDGDKIIDMVKNFEPHTERAEVYGDGKAAEKIVNILKNYFE